MWKSRLVLQVALIAGLSIHSPALQGAPPEPQEEEAAQPLAAEESAEEAEPAPPPETTLRPGDPLELDTEVLKALLRPLTLGAAEEHLAYWLELLQARCNAVRDAEVVALSSEDPDEIRKASEAAVTARAERSRILERVKLVVDAVEQKGGEVDVARAYLSSVVVTPPITGAYAAWTTALAWAKNKDGGLALLRRVGLALAVLFASWVAARILGAVTKRAMRRVPQASELLKLFVVTSVRRIVLLLGLLVALGEMGVNMGPWIAAIGAAGLVVGLALQGTLSNFASGIMIMVYRPFDVGDVIATSGPTGTVEGMTLVTTTIKTGDNQTVHIPNNMVWGNVITNITANQTRRVDMVFGVSYDDDLKKVSAVLMDVLEKHEKVLASPAPVVRIQKLAESSIDFIARPWVKTGDYWEVYWGLNQAVKERFDAEGISIPFPQRDVHLHGAIPAVAGGSTTG